MPLARLQLRLPSREGEKRIIKLVVEKLSLLVPQFPLAEPAYENDYCGRGIGYPLPFTIIFILLYKIIYFHGSMAYPLGREPDQGWLSAPNI